MKFQIPYLSSESAQPIRVLDAACETGLPAVELMKMAAQKIIELDIVGVDFSAEMLEIARQKDVHTKLLQCDLNDDMPLSTDSFDVFYDVRLFLDGHCGPEVLPNITRFVRLGGVGVITVRNKMYIAKEAEYLDAFKKAGLQVEKNSIQKYTEGVLRNFIVLKKA